MRQTIKIVDPNFNAFRQNEFVDDGKEIISLMRKSGVDKRARDEMRVYLAESKSKMAKTQLKNITTRSAHPMYIGTFSPDKVGVYNPDAIPVDTYIRMKSDPQIAIGLAMIKMPLYALNWTVRSESPDIKEFVRSALAVIWRKLIKSMLTAIDFGFSSHEKVWNIVPLDIYTQTPNGRKKTHFSGKGEIYAKIKPHYPASIKIRTDAKTDEFIGIRQAVGLGQFVELDADKCFFFSVEDEFGNYYGQSRMKPAYKAWYWKEVLTQFMLRYFERRGSPASVVTHPTGGGLDIAGNEYDNAEIALRVGQNLVENSVVTLPYEPTKEGKNQWGIEFLTDDRRGEMFVNALNYLGTQVLRGLLTPERVMTQDLSTGSFSMASSHAEIFLLSQEGLIAEMEDAINTQLIPQLIEFNFKPKVQIDCHVDIEQIQYDRKKILKEILIEIIRNLNNLVREGKHPTSIPSMVDMCNVLGVPIKVFEEEYYDSGVPKEETGGNGKTVDNKGKKIIKRQPVTQEVIKE